MSPMSVPLPPGLRIKFIFCTGLQFAVTLGCKSICKNGTSSFSDLFRPISSVVVTADNLTSADKGEIKSGS